MIILDLYSALVFQAEVGRLVSALRVNLGARQRHVKDRMGYRGGKYLGSHKKTAVAKIIFYYLSLSFSFA